MARHGMSRRLNFVETRFTSMAYTGREPREGSSHRSEGTSGRQKNDVLLCQVLPRR